MRIENLVLRAGLSLGICLVLASGAAAGWDSVALSDSVVAFGAAVTGETTSVQMSITNSLGTAVQVTSVGFTGEAFSADLGLVEIPPAGSEVFNVYFCSDQNVDFTEFMTVEVAGSARPLVAEVSAQAHHPGTYYTSTRNLWAEDLKTALTDLIDGHTSLGYTPARDQMYGSIDNHDGYVTCIYTGRSAYFSTRAGATANNFNCEHTWPQSFSDELEPMRSDLFHIYPSDITANSMRANLDFGVVVNATWSVGGSKLGYDSTSQQVFEPRDAHKGNVARTHFYYIIRYDGNYNEYVDPAKMETHFRGWHVSDPVDSLEALRNEDIYALQNNRNPFIDHPAFADRISSFFGTAVRTLEPEIAAAPAELDMGTIGYDLTVHHYIAVVNAGDDTLTVSSITSSNPDFSPGASSLVLAARSYEYVSVSYTSGTSETSDSSTILLVSDDADEGSIGIPVTVQVTDLSGVEPGGPEAGDFFLIQNSPNPFIGRTSIAFRLAGTSAVSLSVYDTGGRLVSRLIDGEQMPPGRHRVEFEGDGLPPGVYFYRLAAGDRVATKRMVLLR
jgi:endonuclease I